MLTHRTQESELLDGIFSALAHPIRRNIIELVAEENRTVSELSEPFSVSRPAISQHLRVLQDANLIEQTAEGRVRICSLNVKPLSIAFSWLVRYRIFWENFLDEIQMKVESEDEDLGQRGDKIDK